MSLQTINCIGVGPIPFDSGAQSVAGGGYVQIATIQLGGHAQFMAFDLIVAGAALSGLEFSRADVAGGTHTVFAQDAACNTVTNDIRSASPASLYTMASGSTGSVRLGELQGVQEIGIWGKSAGAATLQVKGTVSSIE